MALVRLGGMVDPDPLADPGATHVHTEGAEARAGETSGHMRYVLGISIVLAIVILSLVVWGPSLFHQ